MGGEWIGSTLGECVQLKSGGTPSKARSDFWGNGLPWVSAKDMKSFWIEDSEDHLSDLGAQEASFIVEPGTTLMLIRGMTLHHDVPICRVRQQSAFNQDVKAILPRNGHHACFIPYLLLGLKERLLSSVDSAGHGTGRLNTDTLLGMSVNIPPLKEQQAIASILGTLDDKIELNRQRNRTLEAMARALFQSWFVDFDPVKAKAAGKNPTGLKPEIAALFPDSFEESELGMIPKGWKVTNVGSCFDLLMGQSPPGDTYNDNGDGLPFYQGRTDFGFRFPTRRIYCSKPTRLAELGDSLVSVRAPVGDVNVAIEKCAIGRGIAAIRHKSGGKSLTYYAMKSLRSHFEKFEADGTVFGSINKTAFENLPFCDPSEVLIKSFNLLASPFDDEIEVLSRELDCLQRLRELLLPKLISGDLRIPDAERIVSRMV